MQIIQFKCLVSVSDMAVDALGGSGTCEGAWARVEQQRAAWLLGAGDVTHAWAHGTCASLASLVVEGPGRCWGPAPTLGSELGALGAVVGGQKPPLDEVRGMRPWRWCPAAWRPAPRRRSHL